MGLSMSQQFPDLPRPYLKGATRKSAAMEAV
jgi:hypothetical protein